jgi:DNA polymerase epsilon subunit 2
MASLKTLSDRRKAELTSDPVLPSSSPAFATPLPLLPSHKTAVVPPPNFKAPTVLPIILPPTTLRPLAFRAFTKKYNLTLSTSALAALSTFIGKHCGARWKDDGLAEGVLEEVAKLWKKQSTEPIVKGEEATFKNILKTVESCMSGGKIVNAKGLSRQGSFALQENRGRPGLEQQNSFGLSHLDIANEEDEEEETLKDPREWLKVIDAYEQPRMTYNTSKKHFEANKTKPSIFPLPAHKTELFRQRYHIVHQRILRNEDFEQNNLNVSNGRKSDANTKVTPISNLLGRTKSAHLLLGLLIVLPTGALAISDLTGSIPLDLQHAQPLGGPDATFFCPGMLLLIDGIYIEDGTGEASLGSMGGIGATIAGKFIVSLIAHPPPEPRDISLGIKSTNSALGPAFGWTDFLGVGAERATGSRMRRLQSRILGFGAPHQDSTKIVIASHVTLDVPRTLTAVRSLFSHYATKPPEQTPLSIILTGPFTAQPALAGTSSSLSYKEAFNSLAAILSDFPTVLARTTLVFVPGDSDAWPSAHGAGSAVPLPRKGVPKIFTTRVGRVVAEANREVKGRKGREGEVIWASNPSRLTWFGSIGEMAVLSDSISSRLRRSAIRFSAESEAEPTMEVDNHPTDLLDADIVSARRLTKTILDQAHLSPFPISTRPVHWDFGSAMSLFPLPTALVLADGEAQAFIEKYAGCCVMNPGNIAAGGERGEESAWVEYDLMKNVGEIINGRI